MEAHYTWTVIRNCQDLKEFSRLLDANFLCAFCCSAFSRLCYESRSNTIPRLPRCILEWPEHPNQSNCWDGRGHGEKVEAMALETKPADVTEPLQILSEAKGLVDGVKAMIAAPS